jgi:hypothetical protein
MLVDPTGTAVPGSAPTADDLGKRPTLARRPHMPPRRSAKLSRANAGLPARQSKRRLIEGVPWLPSDRPLFRLRDRWWLATDDQLQWVLYRLRGQQWQAVSFPTTRKALLIVLRERVSDRYGTLDGLDAPVVQSVNVLPAHFRDWLREQ